MFRNGIPANVLLDTHVSESWAPSLLLNMIGSAAPLSPCSEPEALSESSSATAANNERKFPKELRILREKKNLKIDR